MKVNYVFQLFEAFSFYFQSENIYKQDSPFLYSFFKEVVDYPHDIDLPKTQKYINSVKHNKTYIPQNKFGAGSRSLFPLNNISKVYRNSSSGIRKIYFILNLLKWRNAIDVLELGTNLGVTTAAISESNVHVDSIEANPFLYDWVKENIPTNENVRLIKGSFMEIIPHLDCTYDCIFIDGDHTFDSTLTLVEASKNLLNKNGVILLDDIRWSTDMTKAWKALLEDHWFNIKLDLFQMGILIKNDDVKYTIKKKIISKKYKPWPIYLFRN